MGSKGPRPPRGSDEPGAPREAGKSDRSARSGHPPGATATPRAREPAALPPFDPRQMQRELERQMAAVQRLLSEHEFASAEEANAFLQEALAGGGGALPAPQPETPLERAQEVVYQAMEATGARRVKLAHRALEIAPDCADAYALLADSASDPREARRLYEEGVRAGERALGPEAFDEGRGHFWGIIETRPYMRAREGLAQVLWFLDERQQAIAHLRDMLELNPGDNQGLRYTLAHWLLEVGDDAGVDELLARYPDEATAAWAYTGALRAFRRHGAGRKADAALRRAFTANRFVPPYLLGVERLPKQLPDYIGLGDRNEAISYVAQAARGWLDAPGVREWLADAFMREAEKQRAPRPPATRRRGNMRLVTPDDASGDAPRS
jgi:tetratricopeptide (TPR) repeat protein